MKNILMLGPALNVKGGVTTVENLIVNDAGFNDRFSLRFIPTHRDAGKAAKAAIALLALARFSFNMIFGPTDIVYIHMAHYASFYRKSIFVLLAALFGKKIIIHMHGGNFDTFYGNAGDRKKRLFKKVINKAARVIVLTDQWKDFYSQLVSTDKIVVIHNGVRIPPVNHYSAESRYITYLGRFDPKKGIYDLLSVVKDIAAEYPGFRFYMAGNGDIDSVRSFITQKGISESVILEDWIDEDHKATILDQTSIFALPSYFEGLPMAVLEALSFGIPVVAADVGGLSEAISNGREGLLFKAGDIEGLKAAIITLLDDAPRRLRMSENAYKKARERFDANIFIEKLTAVFDCI